MSDGWKTKRGIRTKVCLNCNCKNKADYDQCMECGGKKFLSSHVYATRVRIGIQQGMLKKHAL